MFTRTRKWIVAAAAITVTTGCSGKPAKATFEQPTPAAGASTSAAPAAATGQPAGTAAPAHPTDCTAADLDPRPFYGREGAMGNVFQSVIVQNRGAGACRLGSPVKLVYTDSQGARHTLKAARWNVNPAGPAVLPAGGWAAFVVHTTNGQGSGVAECGHEIDYAGVSVVLAGGQPYLLPDFSVRVSCPKASPIVGVGDWASQQRPDPAGGTVSQAPAP